MNLIQSQAIIRQRGQLTIPDELREKIRWLSEGSAIKIFASSEDEVKIVPYQKEGRGVIDWKRIWDKISLVRTFRGEKGNLSRFIVQDRHSH